MNTRHLRAFAERLEELRGLHTAGGDPHGAEKLDALIAKVRSLITDADNILKRLGNPPTE